MTAEHDLKRCACMDCEDRRSVFVVEAWQDLYDAATGPAADLWETVRYWQERSWPDELLDDLRRARQAAIADGDAEAAKALVKAASAL